VVLVASAALAIAAATWRIAERLRADHTPVFWIRAGAASGLLAVAVQAVWQVVLVPAANSVLFAILAAVAIHEARPSVRTQIDARVDAYPSRERARSAADRSFWV
jgi:ammonia channel protein AmtB